MEKIPFDRFGELITCPDLFPLGDVYDADEISVINGTVIFHVNGEDIPSPFSPEQLEIKFLGKDYIKCKPIVWLDNYEFEDTLRYIGRLHFESTTDKKRFLVSSSELDKIIMKMRDGKITGKFTFIRTQGRFFLKFIDENSCKVFDA